MFNRPEKESMQEHKERPSFSSYWPFSKILRSEKSENSSCGLKGKTDVKGSPFSSKTSKSVKSFSVYTTLHFLLKYSIYLIFKPICITNWAIRFLPNGEKKIVKWQKIKRFQRVEFGLHFSENRPIYTELQFYQFFPSHESFWILEKILFILEVWSLKHHDTT